jgi:general secretion pathway protein K
MSRGVALIAVLWVVLLLAVIAGSLTMLTRTELGLSRNLLLSARAEALAEGGIHLAIAELLAPAPGTGFENRSWQVELEDARIDISVSDVIGRVDLNAASPELLAGLLRAGGAGDMSESLADRIADWRDHDEHSRPHGGEQADYSGIEPPVRVGNGAFLTADEIVRIPGMTMELWDRIAGAVTVHSRRPGVNPQHASKMVLLALPGLDETAVDEIIDARVVPDDEPAARQRMAEILKYIPQETRRYLAGGSSNIYAIRARAELAEGAVHIVEAIIEPAPHTDPPWIAHEWRPGSPGQPDEPTK